MTARVLQVILTDDCNIGEGRTNDDPYRLLRKVYTLDGRCIARLDPMDPDTRDCVEAFDHLLRGRRK